MVIIKMKQSKAIEKGIEYLKELWRNEERIANSQQQAINMILIDVNKALQIVEQETKKEWEMFFIKTPKEFEKEISKLQKENRNYQMRIFQLNKEKEELLKYCPQKYLDLIEENKELKEKLKPKHRGFISAN